MIYCTFESYSLDGKDNLAQNQPLNEELLVSMLKIKFSKQPQAEWGIRFYFSMDSNNHIDWAFSDKIERDREWNKLRSVLET